VAAGPVITGISPTYASVGATVTITGTGFGSSRGSSTVRFGSTAVVTYVSWGATQIRVNVPSMSNGSTTVTVVVGGVTSNAAVFSVGVVITVSGFTAANIDTAVASANAGDVVYFPAGIYAHGTLYLKDGVTYRGAGIYQQKSPFGGTWLQCQIRWGSHVTMEQMLIGTNTAGVACAHRPTARGNSANGADTNTNGSHSCLFDHVRFKGGADTGGAIIDIGSNHSSAWNESLKTIDMYDTEWVDCEFERSQAPNDVGVTSLFTNGNPGGSLNIWCDVRAGGARVYNLTFRRCHFGVMNSRAGRTGTDRYGSGTTLLFQPAPFEQGPGAIRPNEANGGVMPANGDAVYAWNPDWDPTSVDHSMHDITFIDCLSEWANWVGVNPCDYARSYSIWRWNDLNRPASETVAMSGASSAAAGWGNPPGSQWPNILTYMWIHDVSFTRCYFKTNMRWELGYDAVSLNSTGVGNIKNYGSAASNTGSFSNATRPETDIFDVDWSGSYTPSPYDPA
jgi:hypothetical protein